MTKRSEKMREIQPAAKQVAEALGVRAGGTGLSKPTLRLWPVAEIVPSADNPRIVTDDEADLDSDGLLTSVRAIGVQQPLQVRDHPIQPGKKELLAGERRWMCCKVASVPMVMVLDYGEMPDDEAFKITCIENAHRKELKPLEQGRAAAIALGRCKGDVKAAAALLGQSPRWIAMGAKIHEGLSKQWQGRLAKDRLFRNWTAGHVALIARFPKDVQEDLFKRFQYRYEVEDISIDELARHTDELLRLIARAPFDTLACQSCAKRSGREPLLWADDAAQVSERNDQCLDGECWKKKEDAAARAYFAEKAREHKGLVAVDLSKYADCRQREALKKIYGDDLIEAYHYGHRTYETVGKDTKGAKPALVVAGPGTGTVKYIKHIKPEPRTDDAPKKSKAESEAARRKKQRLVAVRDHLRRQIESLTSEQIRQDPYLRGVLFCFAFSGSYVDEMHEPERTRFREAWQEQLRGGDPIGFLWKRVWEEIKEGLKDTFAYYDLGDKECEQDLRLITEAFGWDFDGILSQVETELARQESIRQCTQIVKLEVPKRHKAECELRLVEEDGHWYGGFRVHLPKTEIDLPIDTGADQYASKAVCVQAQAEAIRTWLLESKCQKKCSSLLYQDVATALQEVVGASELERKRTEVDRSPDPVPQSPGASCDGNPATCDIGCKPCPAKSRSITDASFELTVGGSIINPERST